MKNCERVQKHVQQMSDSESVVGTLHDSRCGEDVDDTHDHHEQNTGDSGDRTEEPVANRRQEVRTKTPRMMAQNHRLKGT